MTSHNTPTIPTPPAPTDSTELLIDARSKWSAIDVPALWRYRELLWFLALRDLQVRYKQTVFGAAWAVIQPLFKMVLLSVFFGSLAKIPSDGVPYPVFSLAGLLPWQLFAFILTQAGASIVTNEHLISKVYFPRLIVPCSSVLVGLVDFAVAMVVLGVLMAWYGVIPTWRVVMLPVFTVFAVLAALSVGLWLAALTALYRDFRFTLTFIVEIWFFGTPIIYPASAVRPWLRGVLGLNPMTGVIEGFRWCLLPEAPTPGAFMLISVAAMLVLLAGGILYFGRMERHFADRV